MNYVIIGKSTKETDLIKSVEEFLLKEFEKPNFEIGMKKLFSKFAKWNEETKTVSSTSFPSVKDVQIACYLIAKEKKDGEKMPIFSGNDDGATVITLETKTKELFEKAYKNKETKTEFDASKLIIGLLNKQGADMTKEQLDAIQVALDNAKSM